MVAVETYPERYADPLGFAREVNLPLLGTARVRPVPSGAGLAQLLEASSESKSLAPVIDSLTETRRSLTLRSLLVAGFPHDPECFAVGLLLAREWSRRGLRVAVVDLDFWNPTITRPPSHHNEGWVDVIEYGCSFGRVAWEIVSDRLWVIGPGTHPPEESRMVEHPDWARAGRVLAACADVTLYVAPLLDRRGLTGKLSKRMDAAILATSTDRVGRTELRDAFLELWGSDAPMIGCVGIEGIKSAAASPGPDTATTAAALPATPGSKTAQAAPAAPPRLAAPPRAPEPARAAAPPMPRVPAPARARSIAPAPPAPAKPALPYVAPPSRAGEGWGSELAVEAALERDVRRGIVERKSGKRRGRTVLWISLAATLAAIIGAFVVLQGRMAAPPRGSVQAQQPAGEEPIAPATPGSSPEDTPVADDPASDAGFTPT